MADIETAMSTEAATSVFNIRYQIETVAERYQRASNASADAAVNYGTHGYGTTAEILAELADAYGALAELYSTAERMLGVAAPRTEDRTDGR